MMRAMVESEIDAFLNGQIKFETNSDEQELVKVEYPTSIIIFSCGFTYYVGCKLTNTKIIVSKNETKENVEELGKKWLKENKHFIYYRILTVPFNIENAYVYVQSSQLQDFLG